MRCASSLPMCRVDFASSATLLIPSYACRVCRFTSARWSGVETSSAPNESAGRRKASSQLMREAIRSSGQALSLLLTIAEVRELQLLEPRVVLQPRIPRLLTALAASERLSGGRQVRARALTRSERLSGLPGSSPPIENTC